MKPLSGHLNWILRGIHTLFYNYFINILKYFTGTAHIISPLSKRSSGGYFGKSVKDVERSQTKTREEIKDPET